MKAKKFIGPSKKMAAALENEGLRISWPDTITDPEQLAIDGYFYTGDCWEKNVLIDLRNMELNTKGEVDRAVVNQLDAAYEAFDVDEEVNICLDAPGAPDAARLVEDKQEEEQRLKRFMEVADAVASGREIPAEADNTEITISGKDAMRIVELLKKVGDYKYTHSFPDDDKAFANMIADEITNKVNAA